MSSRRPVWLTTLLLLSCFLTISTGCGPAASPPGHLLDQGAGKGRLSFFIDLQGFRGPNLIMQIASIELLNKEGLWQASTFEPITVKAGEIGKGQKFLGRMIMAPGDYGGLRLIVREAAVASESGGESPLQLEKTRYEKIFSSPLRLEEGDSQSLFFTWDTKSSLHDNVFVPALSLVSRQARLIADAAYVACPDIDTVYMISTKDNKVIDSIGIEGGPMYLVGENSAVRQDKIYVLTGRSRELIVFSASANEIIERYSLKMLDKIAHMAISPDDTWAYIVDRNRGDLIQLDLQNGFIANQVRLNYGPNYITYLESANLLAVSLGISQKVVFLNPETLEEFGSVSTSASPEGLATWQDQLLLVAETGSNTMMIYDVNSNMLFKRVMLDFQPKRILASNSTVYVTNYGARSLSIIQPGQFDLSRSIHLSGRPLELAEDPQNRWIYVGNEEEKSIDIIESTINAVVGSIELGTRPSGIIVFE